ncbi:hypothetical protein NFI96_012391 [Prochilodus magdalenae]|nr:hypothetical protein NFI96_012391 [Prochilodus magdalenae]
MTVWYDTTAVFGDGDVVLRTVVVTVCVHVVLCGAAVCQWCCTNRMTHGGHHCSVEVCNGGCWVSQAGKGVRMNPEEPDDPADRRRFSTDTRRGRVQNMAYANCSLKVNRQLLDPSFESYRLSLDSIPSYNVELDAAVAEVKLKDSQYTLDHMKAFGMYNYLHIDPWYEESVYFVDCKGRVLNLTVTLERQRAAEAELCPALRSELFQRLDQKGGAGDNRVRVATTAVEIGHGAGEAAGDVPDDPRDRLLRGRASVCLSQSDVSDLGRPVGRDGKSDLAAHQQERRELPPQMGGLLGPSGRWCVPPAITAPNSVAMPMFSKHLGEPFTILHSLSHVQEGVHTIELLLLRIQKDPADAKGSGFCTSLEWITVDNSAGEREEKKYEVKKRRLMKGRSVPHYAALEPQGKGLMVASEKPFSFKEVDGVPLEEASTEDMEVEHSGQGPPQDPHRCSVLRDSVLRDSVLWASVLRDSVLRDSVLWASVLRDSVLWAGVLRDDVLRDGVLRDGVLRDGVLRDSVLWDCVLWAGILSDLTSGSRRRRDVTVCVSVCQQRAPLKTTSAFKLSVDCCCSVGLLRAGTYAPLLEDVSSSPLWTLRPASGPFKDDKSLEVSLQKRSEGPLWSELVLNDRRGEYVMNEEQAALLHQRLAHLTAEELNPNPEKDKPPCNAQELEECDGFPEDSSTLMRFDGSTLKPTHVVNLGSHQYLFTVDINPSEMPAFCLRHDVDALLWQPRPEEPNDMWEHISTFNALGYVQASKRDKKFATCAPNFSYAALAECLRRVFIYRQPSPVDTVLFNRKQGRQVGQVAKQQVASLESSDPVLGFRATNERLFVLTRNNLFILKDPHRTTTEQFEWIRHSSAAGHLSVTAGLRIVHQPKLHKVLWGSVLWGSVLWGSVLWGSILWGSILWAGILMYSVLRTLLKLQTLERLTDPTSTITDLQRTVVSSMSHPVSAAPLSDGCTTQDYMHTDRYHDCP